MAKSDLTFRIFGKDVTGSKALKGVGKTGDSVGKGLGKFGGMFAGIGTAAVVAGGMVAIDFGKASIDAFTEAQASAAKFDDAFARFPNLAAYKGQVDDLASSLALKTKYDDDQTKAAAATLAKFDLTGDQLKTLIPLTQDYASATGQDLGSSAETVGKAMLGNAKALKALGIVYKPTGDKAKDFATLTDLLTKKVGGFAEKEGKTAAGTAAILGNQFGEVQEQIGSYLVPALTTLGQWIIKDGIPAIQRFVEWFKVNLLPVIQRVAAWVMDTLVPALQEMAATFMRDIWPAIQEVARTIWENLQPAIASLAQLWTETLQPALKDAMPIIAGVIGVIGAMTAGTLMLWSKIIGFVVPAIAEFIGMILKISATAQDVVLKIQEFAGKIVGFITGLPGKIAVASAGMWNGIKDSAKAAFNAVATLWNDSVGSLSFGGPDWVPGLGGKGWDVPDIPMLANGGIVTRPTLALIGEAGPEAVVPLSKGRGMGGETHIHFHGPVMGPNSARWIVDEIDRGVRSGVTSRTLVTR